MLSWVYVLFILFCTDTQLIVHPDLVDRGRPGFGNRIGDFEAERQLHLIANCRRLPWRNHCHLVAQLNIERDGCPAGTLSSDWCVAYAIWSPSRSLFELFIGEEATKLHYMVAQNAAGVMH